MPEEEPKEEKVEEKEVEVEILERRLTTEYTTEGREVKGYRIAFSTPDIPYETVFIPEKEYSEEREAKEIKKKIKEFVVYKPEVKKFKL